jgi:CO/xanthine dehydrogenase Mo-binding subunit
MKVHRMTRRTFLKTGGVVVVAMSVGSVRPGRIAAQTTATADRFLGKTVATDAVDGFLAIHSDGTVTLFSGKVDLGTGARAALRQMAAEELDVPLDRIAMIEGDTALTPDQGPTAGSYGVARGGMQIRRAAATARQALLDRAAQRLGRPVSDLGVIDGVVRPMGGGNGVSYADLVGDQRLNLQVNEKVPLKNPAKFRLIGKPAQRNDVPGKVTGRHGFVHDFSVPGMLHGRAIRPPAVGATLLSVDETSIAAVPGVRVVQIGSFLGVCAEREWDAVRAARQLKATWSPGKGLPEHARLYADLRASALVRDETLATRGDVAAAFAAGGRSLSATYEWPSQSHASMGPSCAVADVRPDRATIWTGSQATHRFRMTFARILGLPQNQVRLIYLDGSGCYGMNGHEDAAADAALMSRAVGRPVRVQWSREDEHGWDPKGPPHLLDIRAAVNDQGEVVAWLSEAWLPAPTPNLPNVPLLAPEAAGIAQPMGISTGLIHQNVDPPYQFPNMRAVIHWIRDTPLRTSNLRAPGKVANCFAVESFTDELATLVGADPVEFRLRYLKDPRGIEVIRRAAARFGWAPRPRARAVDSTASILTGRGFAYVHYKHNETYAAVAAEVEVERRSGRIRVTRLACAQDCGLIVNPDCVRGQVEGCLLQAISRTLFEAVTYDRSHVTSVDWATYPVLAFSDVPAMEIDLIDRPVEPPIGVGEAAGTPVPGAITSAVYDATGVRLRSVPFRPERVQAALKG